MQRHPSMREMRGGRFWALEDGADDDECEDDPTVSPASGTSSPTPSDILCETLASGYSEEDVEAGLDVVLPMEDPAREGLAKDDQVEVLRRVVHRRMAATKVRPWRGPLPKVRPLTATFLDFFNARKW